MWFFRRYITRDDFVCFLISQCVEQKQSIWILIEWRRAWFPNQIHLFWVFTLQFYCIVAVIVCVFHCSHDFSTWHHNYESTFMCQSFSSRFNKWNDAPLINASLWWKTNGWQSKNFILICTWAFVHVHLYTHTNNMAKALQKPPNR